MKKEEIMSSFSARNLSRALLLIKETVDSFFLVVRRSFSARNLSRALLLIKETVE